MIIVEFVDAQDDSFVMAMLWMAGSNNGAAKGHDEGFGGVGSVCVRPVAATTTLGSHVALLPNFRLPAKLPIPLHHVTLILTTFAPFSLVINLQH